MAASGWRAVGVAAVGSGAGAGERHRAVAGIMYRAPAAPLRLQVDAGQQAVDRRGQCGDRHPDPTDDPGTGPAIERRTGAPFGGDQITAIGDSVMLASAAELQNAFPGIYIDAVVSRQLCPGAQIVEAMLAAGLFVRPW